MLQQYWWAKKSRILSDNIICKLFKNLESLYDEPCSSGDFFSIYDSTGLSNKHVYTYKYFDKFQLFFYKLACLSSAPSAGAAIVFTRHFIGFESVTVYLPSVCLFLV